ncbi:Uu.00g034160.m01.CDS01 [Anthostomella pinea]|uniref:Uu.00g034160.m01.CDS01 n=1 Tax=Anthostomella pinea TaxID=933095 RepID=A0AAI8V930_9PEZI|nr:Uu.00g034160.m01.CDS01 [Anthostomella pinea]
MSGPPGTALNVTSDATDAHTRAVAEKLECGTGSDEKTLKCLRGLSMETLLEAAMEHSVNNHPPNGLFTFIPSVDGDFIPDRHSVLYKAGRFAKGIPIVYGWTHDDGSGNAGPPSNFQTEEDMKGAFKTFVHALTDDDYTKLFSLYPASDFEEESSNYELTRRESDPPVPIPFFRVSRILRDLLFSCTSVGFGYEMSRQSKALDPSFPGVRLYDLNQSMLTPMIAAIGMPYMGACHGSDSHYILNGLFPEGEVSESDQILSRSMAGSFINFAYNGDPAFAGDEHLDSWPESFPEPGHPGAPLPPAVNVQLSAVLWARDLAL